MKNAVFSSVVLLALTVLAEASIQVREPQMRWLFGGLGFQHPEAALTALMTDEYRDERALKTFHEISPTFGRAYTAFSECPKDRLDRFADWYDLTFRKAGTTVLVCPSTMPGDAFAIDPVKYAEGCAKNFAYLVREKGCRKLRYYTLSNEMGTLDGWGWFLWEPARLLLWSRFVHELAVAFRKEGLESVDIVGPDFSGNPKRQDELMRRTIKENDGDLGAYVTHWYMYGREPGDLSLYDIYYSNFTNCVQLALEKHKRFLLGEFGFSPTRPRPGVMIDDWSVNGRAPELAPKAALSMAEMVMAAVNAGTFGISFWSFTDYPDPFVAEDGDTPKEQAVFDSTKSCYRPDLKYNKWGMFRWSDATRDYRSYPSLYTVGLMAKFFRKGATVLPCEISDKEVRASALLNPDGSVTMALLNWGAAKKLGVAFESKLAQPFRRYVYEAANVPYSDFNDLPAHRDLVAAKDGEVSLELPADSLTLITTDYRDRVPTAVVGIRVSDGALVWQASADPDHRYYRVYRDGKQIASTVATSFVRGIEPGATYDVRSVDRWGNLSAPGVAAGERDAADCVRARRGAARLLDIAAIPVYDPGARVGYCGSIDPSGDNADWDWGEVQDENGEWILFEDEGAGCIYNFTQHRNEGVEVPEFRFYFDGEREPRLRLKPRDFGTSNFAPAPLGGAFTTNRTSAVFRIVRNFLPLEYTNGVKVTSTVKLYGKGDRGGWGHILYHHYDSAEGLFGFRPVPEIAAAVAKRFSELPLAAAHENVRLTRDETLAAGAERAVYEQTDGHGVLTAIELAVAAPDPSLTTNLWILLDFDGRRTVEAPLGTFFGCEAWGRAAKLETALLTFDISDPQLARFSNRFPMPYFQSAKVTLQNRGKTPIKIAKCGVSFDTRVNYDPKTTGIFTASKYYPKTQNVQWKNAKIGRLVGRGMLAYGVISGYNFSNEPRWGACEGDVRCFIDDMTVPRVQSDGSESWGSWGWGFSRPPQMNPFSWYHCRDTESDFWSELRLTYADSCNFRRFLRFDLEHGAANDHPESFSSGQIFGYLLP